MENYCLRPIWSRAQQEAVNSLYVSCIETDSGIPTMFGSGKMFQDKRLDLIRVAVSLIASTELVVLDKGINKFRFIVDPEYCRRIKEACFRIASDIGAINQKFFGQQLQRFRPIIW